MMVRKIVVIGHPDLAGVIESPHVPILGFPDGVQLKEAMQQATGDGTPGPQVGILTTWDMVGGSAESTAQLAKQLIATDHKVVVFLDDNQVDPGIFQGIPLAMEQGFSVDDLARLLTETMGVMVQKAGGNGADVSSPVGDPVVAPVQEDIPVYDLSGEPSSVPDPWSSPDISSVDVATHVGDVTGGGSQLSHPAPTDPYQPPQAPPDPYQPPQAPQMPSAPQAPQSPQVDPWAAPQAPQAPTDPYQPPQQAPQAPQMPPAPQAPQSPQVDPWAAPQQGQPSVRYEPPPTFTERGTTGSLSSPQNHDFLPSPTSPVPPSRPDPFASGPAPSSPSRDYSRARDYYEAQAPSSPENYYSSKKFSKKAQVHTFAVPKGGTGKSSLAAVYAAVLALGLRNDEDDPDSGGRVLLIDANVQQADSRRIMGLRPQKTILDLARTVYDENNIEAYLTPPSPANPMWLLAGPLNKAEADPTLVTPSVYRRATEILLERFDHIIIDTPEARLYDPMLADYATPITDWLIVPVLQNRPVLDGTKEWLQLIQAPRHVGGYAFESARVRLVMNMVRNSVGYKTESLSVDLAAWEFAGEVAYSDRMAQATNEYRLPLDDEELVNSVRGVIYSVTGNKAFLPSASTEKGSSKGKKKGKGGMKGKTSAAGIGQMIKKMIS